MVRKPDAITPPMNHHRQRRRPWSTPIRSTAKQRLLCSATLIDAPRSEFTGTPSRSKYDDSIARAETDGELTLPAGCHVVGKTNTKAPRKLMGIATRRSRRRGDLVL